MPNESTVTINSHDMHRKAAELTVLGDMVVPVLTFWYWPAAAPAATLAGMLSTAGSVQCLYHTHTKCASSICSNNNKNNNDNDDNNNSNNQ